MSDSMESAQHDTRGHFEPGLLVLNFVLSLNLFHDYVYMLSLQ